MEKPKKTNIGYWLLAITAIVFDQITKIAILNRFQDYERLNVIPNFFDLTLVYNTGAAFSFLADAGGWQKFFFIGLAFVICGWLVHEIVKDKFGLLGKFGAAMVIGGALGNVIDRFIHGKVVDFLLFYYQNWFYPAFNFADSCIVVGAALLVIDGFQSSKKEKAAANSSQAAG